MRLTPPVAGRFEFSLEKNDWHLRAKDFIEEVKGAVPSGEREYDPETGVWTIKEAFFPIVREMRDRYFIPPNHDLFE